MKYKAKSWEPDPSLTIDDNARFAITSKDNIAILAGPGAGKTELLAQRACYLLQTGIVPWPKRIMALVFKREAAVNLRERVRLRVGSDMALRFDCFTFHSFAKSLVERFRTVLPESERPVRGFGLIPSNRSSNFPQTIYFDDVVPLSTKILKLCPELNRAFSMTYGHVFLDEFQDTRPDQYDLLKSIFSSSNAVVTAVGDTNQAIMNWADAMRGIFKEFLKDFSAQQVALNVNFRASKELQRMVNGYVYFANFNRLPQISSQIPSSSCEFIPTNEENEEAIMLSERIRKHLIDNNLSPHDVCVLVRGSASDYTKELQAQLQKRDLHSIDETSLQDELLEPLGLLITSSLRLFFDPFNHDAKYKLEELLFEVHAVIDEDNDKTYRLIQGLSKTLKECRSRIQSSSGLQVDTLKELTKSVINYLNWGKIKSTWMRYADESFSSNTFNRIFASLEEKKGDVGSWLKALDILEGKNAVRIMTIHKCKGLEFHTVILLGLEDQAFWGFQNQRDDEIANIFVAISRAREVLWITYTGQRAWRSFPSSVQSSINGIYCIYQLLERLGIVSLSSS